MPNRCGLEGTLRLLQQFLSIISYCARPEHTHEFSLPAAQYPGKFPTFVRTYLIIKKH